MTRMPSPLPDVPTVQLVLASASPARLSTLRAAGIEPVVVVSEVDEDLAVAEATERYGPLEPADIALLLARAKAEDVAARVDDGAVVLGCDSVLELDGEVHGKPADAGRGRRAVAPDARAFGCAAHGSLARRRPGAAAPRSVRRRRRPSTSRSSPTRRSTPTSPPGEPLAVAGAFTIDGLGGAFVTAVEGDHHNVVGLSLPLLRELLADAGIEWFDVVGGASPPATGRLRGRGRR